MTNITHNNIIYLPHELKTRIHKVKKYRNGNSIEFIVENNTAKTSIRPLKKILYKKFEQSIFSEEELKRNEESVKLREEVFSLLEEVFSRSLSPIEISRADEWIKANVDRDIIINSIKDAKVRNELSINAIDRIIINKIRSLNN